MQQMTQILTGSYSSEDVVFLLKDLSDASLERSLNEREEAIQRRRPLFGNASHRIRADRSLFKSFLRVT